MCLRREIRVLRPNPMKRTIFANHYAEERYLAALKSAILCRIEAERWRRVMIEHRAQWLGRPNYFRELASEKLELSKKDERFLKSVKVQI